MNQVAPYQYELKEYGNIQNAVDYFLNFQIEKDKKILDIGTNLGSFPYELHKRGYKLLHGSDVREEAIKYGRQQHAAIGHDLSCYDGHTIPFHNENFDVVTMVDVIEHIPGKYLGSIGPFLLKLSDSLPSGIYPNFYGSAVK